MDIKGKKKLEENDKVIADAIWKQIDSSKSPGTFAVGGNTLGLGSLYSEPQTSYIRETAPDGRIVNPKDSVIAPYDASKLYDFSNMQDMQNNLLYSNTSKFKGVGSNLKDYQKENAIRALNTSENAKTDLAVLGYTPTELSKINALSGLSYVNSGNAMGNINQNVGNSQVLSGLNSMFKDPQTKNIPNTINTARFGNPSSDVLAGATLATPAYNRTASVSPNSPSLMDGERVGESTKPITDFVSKSLGTVLNFFNMAPDFIVQMDRAKNERLSGVGKAPEDILNKYTNSDIANEIVDTGRGKYARWYADLLQSDPARAEKLSEGATGIRGVGNINDSFDFESGIAGGLQDLIQGGMYAIDNFGKNTENTWNQKQINDVMTREKLVDKYGYDAMDAFDKAGLLGVDNAEINAAKLQALNDAYKAETGKDSPYTSWKQFAERGKTSEAIGEEGFNLWDNIQQAINPVETAKQYLS